jgi:16S rRNA (guanine527-N7)-methyltransferase
LNIDEFQRATGVSRETRDRLSHYAELLLRWNHAINLVANGSLRDLWNRHFLDSAQLLPQLPGQGVDSGDLVDFGSGAGFPGLVLAIMGADHVHLIERDGRKCAFLREVAYKTAAPVTVHSMDIAKIKPWPVKAVTARAFAPLSTLLPLAAPFIEQGALGLFLKGKALDDELTQASKEWRITADRVPSASDPAGCILRVRKLGHDHPKSD